jgi:hypothetical protein
MTFFFFKQKPLEVIAYTDKPLIYENFPIINSSKMLPDYYKKMPSRKKVNNPHPIDNQINYFSTIKRCYGVNQFNLTGFTVPLWSDYSIVINGDVVNAKGAGCQPQKLTADFHDEQQVLGAIDDVHVLKLKSPWVLNCKEDTKFMYMQNFYQLHSPLWYVPPGIVNYKYQNGTHIFFLIKKGLPNQEIFLNAGMALTKIVPLTERPVNLKLELVDDVDKVRKVASAVYFSNVVSKLIKHSQKNKCPFGKD